jgi:hypothetical protein
MLCAIGWQSITYVHRTIRLVLKWWTRVHSIDRPGDIVEFYYLFSLNRQLHFLEQSTDYLFLRVTGGLDKGASGRVGLSG